MDDGRGSLAVTDMVTALIRVSNETAFPPSRFEALRSVVLDGVVSKNSKRNYSLALGELSAFCNDRQESVSRTLIQAFRAALLARELSASTINVKMSAVRKLITEAKRAGVVNAEDASQMTDVPNVQQRGN